MPVGRDQSTVLNIKLTSMVVGLGIAFCLVFWLSSTAAGIEVDRWLLLQLQSIGDETAPRGPGWVREASRDLTALGSVSVLLFALLAGMTWILIAGDWRRALWIGLIVGGGITASFLLKLCFDQPRPDLVTNPTHVFTSSFPSSHAMSSLVVYVALARVLGHYCSHELARRYLLGLAVAISVISGTSRVYLGVHWPSDVLAGWIAGSLWLLLMLPLVSDSSATRRTRTHGA